MKMISKFMMFLATITLGGGELRHVTTIRPQQVPMVIAL